MKTEIVQFDDTDCIVFLTIKKYKKVLQSVDSCSLIFISREQHYPSEESAVLIFLCYSKMELKKDFLLIFG